MQNAMIDVLGGGQDYLLLLPAVEAVVVQANRHTMKPMNFRPASRSESDSARRRVSISVAAYCRLDAL